MGKDEINDIIEDAYENTNFGSIEKIYSYLQKNNNKSISRQQIKTFLALQEEQQILKQTQKPKNGGHIIAMYPNEVWQMDIFIFDKYKYNNKNHQYILAAIDVFTRFAYTVPMKKKYSSKAPRCHGHR